VDLVYSDIQAQYRTQVQRFAQNVLRPLVETEFDFSQALDSEDVARFRKRIESHEIATTAPTVENGDLDLICFGIFIEEISRVNCGLASLANALFFPVWDMVTLLDAPQLERYGHLFAPGQIISMGLSEPNVGSNPSQIETVATRTEDGWLLNGQKLWTSHALVAGGVMVAARKIEDGERGEIALFLVDRGEQKYDIRKVPLLGFNAVSTCEVTFEDCWVPGDAEIAAGRGGLQAALKLVEQGRLKIIFMAVGVAQASLDLAAQYARDRTQFGRPIGSFQLVQEMLADMAIQVEASRLLAYRAASLYQQGLPARSAVSMAKAFSTEAAVHVTSLGIQVHGAIGLTKECKAEQYFRDARMMTIPDGTTQIHKLVIGRELTGLNAFA
jgi:alkylation response protein AidB-like acyl-CoA dehydrogenase